MGWGGYLRCNLRCPPFAVAEFLHLNDSPLSGLIAEVLHDRVVGGGIFISRRERSA
jgi:hypothetical protein